MDTVIGQHALRVAQQLGAIGGARRILDLVEQGVELRRFVAPVVAGLGEVAQIKRLDVRDDREVVGLVGVGAAEPLRPFDVFDLRDDADLGELRGDYFATLARIGRGRQLQA